MRNLLLYLRCAAKMSLPQTSWSSCNNKNNNSDKKNNIAIKTNSNCCCRCCCCHCGCSCCTVYSFIIIATLALFTLFSRRLFFDCRRHVFVVVVPLPLSLALSLVSIVVVVVKFTKKFQLKCNNAALHHQRRQADKPRTYPSLG